MIKFKHKFTISILSVATISSLFIINFNTNSNKNIVSSSSSTASVLNSIVVTDATPTSIKELNANDYKVNVSTEGLFKVSDVDKKIFSLKNASPSSDFWSMSFQGSISPAYSFKPFIANIKDFYQFNSQSFGLNDLTLQNLNTDGISINYTLYDDSFNAISDFLNPAIWNISSYTRSNKNQLYGFSEGPTNRQNLFNESIFLNKDSSLLLVSSKFGNETIVPTWRPNSQPSDPTPINFGNGIYELDGMPGWFSSGYFVNEKNTISFYVPKKTQEQSDFELDTSAVTADLKKMTANDFMNANVNNFSDLLALNIKNSLPISIPGKLTAEVFNNTGKIVFKYQPSKLISVEKVAENKFYQNGLIDNSDPDGGLKFVVGEISGFYTNTSINGGTNIVSKPIGSIGGYVSANEITIEQLQARVLEIKNELWNECPDLELNDIVILKDTILRPSAGVHDKSWIKFQVYPKFIYVNGDKVENNSDNPQFKLELTFTGFSAFEKTNIEPKTTFEPNDYIPSELPIFFKDGDLKSKLLIYCNITGNITDVNNVVIDSIEVQNPNDQAGTATLIIKASNCRLEDQSKGDATFTVNLSNIKTIKDTIIDNDALQNGYDFISSSPFTVEKFIYDVYTKSGDSYDNFMTWIKKQVLLNEPIDANITTEFDATQPSFNYSNKKKQMNLTISLDKYYANGSTHNEKKEFSIVFVINNASVPNSPTSLTSDGIEWQYDNLYANEITDDNIKEYLWAKLNPPNDGDLNDILSYPRNSNGSKLSKNDIKYTIVNESTKNIDGFITLNYQLNTYYDNENLNTVWWNEGSPNETEVLSLKLETKDINLTKWNDGWENDVVNVTGFSDILASNFSELNNNQLIEQLKTAMQLGGYLDGVTVTYQIDGNQNQNDIYNGKLKLNVTINQAMVYDENNSNPSSPGGKYTKPENVTFNNVIISGFKKYGSTQLVNNSASILDLEPTTDTTANDTEWTIDNLKKLVFKHKDKFFKNLPNNFVKDNIVIDNVQYNAFGLNNVASDNPTIVFEIFLNNYLSVSNDNVDVGSDKKSFGRITLTDFRKSVATSFSIEQNAGKDTIIPQKVDDSNFKENIDLSKLVTNIVNAPTNFDSNNDVSVVITPNSWNNKDGTLTANVTINNIYVDIDKTFPKGSFSQEVNITGFKKIQPTSLKTDTIQIDASDYYASNIPLYKLKELIFAKRDELFANLDDSFQSTNIILEETSLERINNDNDEGKIIIRYDAQSQKGLKINNYYDNDSKYTWINGTQEKLFDQEIIITGFKQKLPTKINSEITIDSLSKFVAQQVTTSAKSEIETLIKNFIFDNRNTLFNSLPDNGITIDDISVAIVGDSWNNKEGSIKTNVTLKKYVNDKGQDVVDGSAPKVFDDIKILGFQKITSGTSMLDKLNKTINSVPSKEIDTYPDNTDISVIKSYIIKHQKEIFNSIPYAFIGDKGFGDGDLDVVSTGTNLVEGSIMITIKILKYYQNNNLCSYIDASTSGDKLEISGVKFLVNSYKPTDIPSNITDIVLDPSITINNVPISNVLAQDFVSPSANKDSVTNAIKKQVAGMFSGQSINITEQDIEIVYSSNFDNINFDNINGTVQIESIKIINNKWIGGDGHSVEKFEITSSNLPYNKAILVSGFKKITPTNVLQTMFNSFKMTGFDASKYADLYPNQIVHSKQSELTSEFKSWLISNNTSWVSSLNIPTTTRITDFLQITYINNFSNKNGTISFKYSIDKQYVFSGYNGAYGNKGISGTLDIEIGTKIANISSVNNTVSISSSKLWGVTPSEFKDQNSSEFTNIIKDLIVKNLIEEKNANQNDFLAKNSLFSNLPKEWLNLNEDQIKNAINIEFKSLDDGNGTMTFSISLNGVPYFVEKEGDYFLEESYSTTMNKSTSFSIKGFKTSDPFPLIPVVLSAVAFVIIVIIIALSLYFFYKKRKYKTVTVASKSEL